MHKDIIWFGNSYYGSPFKVGCNYYSEEAAKRGNQVLFVSPPVSIFHFFSQEGRRRLKTAFRGVQKTKENYFVFTPFSVLPPAKRLPIAFSFVYKIWYKFTFNGFSTVLKQNTGEQTKFVVDYFAFNSIIKPKDYAQTLVRITDNLAKFKVNSMVSKIEDELITNAKKVVFTASTLQKRIDALNKNNVFLPNGVQNAKFRKDVEKPAEYSKIRESMIAVYVGAIEEWFDFELLYQTASKTTEVHYFIIGPVKVDSTAYQQIKKLKNITFAGKIDNHKIVPYLKHARIGIIPFDLKNELVHSISPLKLYEYMAAGLSVIATKWEELIRIKSPAYLVENSVEFVAAINQIKTRENQEDALAFAQQNDWANKYNSLQII